MCEFQNHFYVGDNDDISQDALNAYNLIKNGNFIEGLNRIGYAIGTLSKYDSSDNDYNSTDCVSTSKALYKLFDPIYTRYTNYCDKNQNTEIANLVISNNFIGVVVRNISYHRFILIKF